MVAALRARDPSAWVDFMMRFELGLERPDPRRAVGERAHHRRGAYVVGGFIPLGPYMALAETRRGARRLGRRHLVALALFG